MSQTSFRLLALRAAESAQTVRSLLARCFIDSPWSWASHFVRSAIGLASIAIALIAVHPSNALADPSAADASDLSDAGALAASMGQYGYAIEAFKGAFRVSQSPDLLFAIAEAYRQRYALDGDAIDLHEATIYYQRYREAAPTGEHALEALRTLERETPELAALSIDQTLLEKTLREEASTTRIGVFSSVSSAVVRIDKGRAAALPIFASITPGKHVLTVSAPDYVSTTIDVDVSAGTAVAENVSLEPTPARLDVREQVGADVIVDGVAIGVAPFPKPVDVDPGKHTVTLSMNGHLPHTERLFLTRGKTKKLSVELAATRQRKVAWASVGVGLAGIATGIGLGVFAVVKDRAAQTIGDRNRTLSAADQQREDDDIAARNRFRVGAGIAGGVGLGLAVVGGCLFAFDGDAPKPPPPKSGRGFLHELSVIPLVSPTFAGGSAQIRF